MSETALSTSWNLTGDEDIANGIRDIRKTGFSAIELGFMHRPESVELIHSVAKKVNMRIRSLHNYCPIPEGVRQNKATPDCYSMSSLDEDERRKAISYTKQTIETAAAVGAGAVVLHCGRTAGKDLTRRLIDIYRRAGAASRAFIETRNRMRGERAEKARAYFEQALISLDELDIFAKKAGVALGIENRFYFLEIPSFKEMGEILRRFAGSAIRYWHDTGHAQVSEELGFGAQIDYLNSYGGNMAGIHLHDVKNLQDHISPGTGDFDFSILRRFLNESTIKVMEVHKTESAEDVKAGRRHLEEVLR